MKLRGGIDWNSVWCLGGGRNPVWFGVAYT